MVNEQPALAVARNRALLLVAVALELSARVADPAPATLRSWFVIDAVESMALAGFYATSHRRSRPGGA
jgi:hypothetical protein